MLQVFLYFPCFYKTELICSLQSIVIYLVFMSNFCCSVYVLTHVQFYHDKSRPCSQFTHFLFFWQRFSGFVERYRYIFLYLPSAELWTWPQYIVTSVTFAHSLFMWCAQKCFCIYLCLQVCLVKLCAKYRCTFFVIRVLYCMNALILSYLLDAILFQRNLLN